MPQMIFIIVATLLVAALVILAWWKIPILALRSTVITEPKDRRELEDAYRKTLAQIFAGFAVLLTFGWTLYKDRESLDQTRQQLASQQKQLDSQQEQMKSQQDQFGIQYKHSVTQISNQLFFDASKLLKRDESDATRSAALFALARIPGLRPEYLDSVIDTVVAFIKGGTKVGTEFSEPLRLPVGSDVQTAIIVLRGLRSSYHKTLDLSDAHLTRTNFSGSLPSDAFEGANLENAALYGVDLSELNLKGTKFNGSRIADWEAYKDWSCDTPEDIRYLNVKHRYIAKFSGSILVDAGFDNAWVGGADFSNACLAGAKFWKTDLSRANFSSAKFGKHGDCGINMPEHHKAHFLEATLLDAVFNDADISGVSFHGAKLSGADFRSAKNANPESFVEACHDLDRPAKFSSDVSISLKPCTPRALRCPEISTAAISPAGNKNSGAASDQNSDKPRAN